MGGRADVILLEGDAMKVMIRFRLQNPQLYQTPYEHQNPPGVSDLAGADSAPQSGADNAGAAATATLGSKGQPDHGQHAWGG